MSKYLFILAVLLLAGCHPLSQLSDAEISVQGSTWDYTDDDATYQIEFAADGQLTTTHPNDATPDNDTWRQDRRKIHFEYNNGYSKYDGVMKTKDLIVGTAKNSSMTWTWTMKRRSKLQTN